MPGTAGISRTTNDNNYQLFSGGGMDFVIVHLTFCPPAAAVTWADSVFKAYPDRVGIMTTHGVSERVGAAHDARVHATRSTCGTTWPCRIRTCASC